MRNLKVIISYNGANYHGFQTQNNAVTVQQVIESALSGLLGESAAVVGCSRTDAGVHAREFCFNVKTCSPIPCDGFVKALNGLLPRDIAVHSCEEVGTDFHARYCTRSKEYVYLICCGGVRDVFMKDLAYFYPRSLDLVRMNEAAGLFVGEHDFSAYCKAESLETVLTKPRGAVREVYELSVREYSLSDRYIEIIIRGSGFLHNMVRIIAGTLVYVSEGKLSLSNVKETLSGVGKRETAGVTLPASGLYLNRVIY
ncbi:MAG: tRNA pseudouridine(38-40) synthase TruA [Oscillospiraceae bacterium]|nr:tRNA pseudouridine(38-40) synthase TruA [Oscillospiraceae bacterium]